MKLTLNERAIMTNRGIKHSPTLFKSNNPYQRVRPTYLKTFIMSDADIFTCWKDWVRERNKESNILVMNHRIEIISERYNKFATQEDLLDCWKDFLLANILDQSLPTIAPQEDKPNHDRNGNAKAMHIPAGETTAVRSFNAAAGEVINAENSRVEGAAWLFMKSFLHQGGALFMLQIAIFEHLNKFDYHMDSSVVKRSVNIKPSKGTLTFHETFEATRFLWGGNPEYCLASRNLNIPLIKGQLLHHFVFNKDGTYSHVFDDVVIDFDNAETQRLLDHDPQKISISTALSFIKNIKPHHISVAEHKEKTTAPAENNDKSPATTLLTKMKANPKMPDYELFILPKRVVSSDVPESQIVDSVIPDAKTTTQTPESPRP
jgi:hypothetical protein